MVWVLVIVINVWYITPNDSRTKIENKWMILIVVERLKEKIQKVDNEDDSLAHKATLKENSFHAI